MGTGLFMLSLCAFLVFGRASEPRSDVRTKGSASEAKTEPLQEPLLEDPMWNEEGSAEEGLWKRHRRL